MKSLLLAQGVEDSRAAQLVDAIADWRDNDDLKRPNGAEDADYRAAGLKYGPANGPFEAVADLGRVLGMTSDLYTRLARLVTVYSRQQGVNPQTASRDVLLALPNATPEAVDLFMSQRAAALAARQPVPAFPPAQGFASGAVPVWRIHAEATMPDGVTFVREAVLRPSADPRRPLVALAWLEAPRAPPQAPAAAQDSSTAMAAPVAATSTSPGGATRSGSLMKSYGR
jgi:general secretion pathway protein K